MFRLESKGFEVPGRGREGTTAGLPLDEAILRSESLAFSLPGLPGKHSVTPALHPALWSQIWYGTCRDVPCLKGSVGQGQGCCV